jgi:RimJ/RimL family protein N-acetyltransferase
MASIGPRLRRALNRYGLRGTARRGAHKLAARVALSERRVWYVLDLDGARPRPVQPVGLTLRRAAEAELALLSRLATLWPSQARERLMQGADRWLVVDHDEPMFSCWIFRASAPVLAGRHGRLELPSGTLCLEDSFTAAAARGRGIAPAAWGSIADELAREAQRRLITKVEVDNASTRRAVEKAGSRELAVMRFRRVVPWRRTPVQTTDVEEGAFFDEALGHY